MTNAQHAKLLKETNDLLRRVLAQTDLLIAGGMGRREKVLPFTAVREALIAGAVRCEDPARMGHPQAPALFARAAECRRAADVLAGVA